MVRKTHASSTDSCLQSIETKLQLTRKVLAWGKPAKHHRYVRLQLLHLFH